MDIKLHFALAFAIRLALVAYGYFQDALFEVKYTDVDYHVFSDAAQYVSEGLSPFKRHTYRYTPFLAFMLVPNVIISDAFGKLLFCIFDVLTSMLIYNIQRNFGFNIKLCRVSTFLWLYNPLPIVIATRGNAESIMTFLIMLSISFYQVDRLFLFGSFYGLAVHFKIYPCIYVASFYFIISCHTTSSGWNKLKILLLPNKKKFLFIMSSLLGFALPTILSLAMYKEEYLHEALLYHLTRKDIRHNFSPYFYILYLSESSNPWLSSMFSSVAFFLQAALILLVSWIFPSPQALPACMFIETFIFVSFNKVCTSQYFLWYLCLFPLTYPVMNGSMKYVILAFFIWITGQALWLLPAYYLEFKGRNTFFWICISSLLFFLINIYLVCLFIKCVSKSLNVVCKEQTKNK